MPKSLTIRQLLDCSESEFWERIFRSEEFNHYLYERLGFDYELEEWDEALKFAEETWTDRTAEYLVGTPLLADYLAEGLQAFETQAED